ESRTGGGPDLLNLPETPGRKTIDRRAADATGNVDLAVATHYRGCKLFEVPRHRGDSACEPDSHLRQRGRFWMATKRSNWSANCFGAHHCGGEHCVPSLPHVADIYRGDLSRDSHCHRCGSLLCGDCASEAACRDGGSYQHGRSEP